MCFVNLVVYLFLLLSTGKGEFAKFIMFNPILFTRGSIHQGDCRFSDISRGRQCALLCANLCDISTWTTETVDRVLVEGDSRFLKAFEEGSIPDAETISLNYLPDRVVGPTMTENKSLNEANNQYESPDVANNQYESSDEANNNMNRPTRQTINMNRPTWQKNNMNRPTWQTINMNRPTRQTIIMNRPTWQTINMNQPTRQAININHLTW